MATKKLKEELNSFIYMAADENAASILATAKEKGIPESLYEHLYELVHAAYCAGGMHVYQYFLTKEAIANIGKGEDNHS